MVLACQDNVPHARLARGTRPSHRIVEIGVEVVEVRLVVCVADFLVFLNPFVARGQRVNSPVNEKAETVMCPPSGIAERWFGLGKILGVH